jgi:transcriptional regulator with GAF, ATPase, and Fis domain
LIASGEAIFVDDVAAAPRDRWEGSGTGYNTFISCPITTPSNSYGMLTVDAVNTDDLTEQNLSDLRLIAGILAVAFSLRNGAA